MEKPPAQHCWNSRLPLTFLTFIGGAVTFIKKIEARDGNDSIEGGTSSTEIRGGSGADIIYGNKKNSAFEVNDNVRDTLIGGAGSDKFYISPLEAGVTLSGFADYSLQISWWDSTDTIEDDWSSTLVFTKDKSNPENENLLVDFTRVSFSVASHTAYLLINEAAGESKYGANLFAAQIGADAYLYNIISSGSSHKLYAMGILKNFQVASEIEQPSIW